MARFYIGNLSQQTAEPELQAWIEEHGFKVDTVQIIRDLDSGESRRFAFVELPEVLAAEEAVDSLNGKNMEGQALRISPARPLPVKNEARPDSPGRTPKKRAS